MSDQIQVSNARRVVFTAMALVVFWVLVWRGYWLLPDSVSNRGNRAFDLLAELMEFLPRSEWAFLVPISCSFALAPTILFSIGTHGFVLRLRDRVVLIVGTLFAVTLGLSVWLGVLDLRAAVKTLPHDPTRSFSSELRLALDHHEVSWFSLLLPIILTTAFVIYGAWRSAVRDVEAAGEDDV